MQGAPPSPNIIPDGTLLDGKFRILRCIGRGGMGAVYEIQHAITKHRRALKMLYPFVVRDRDAVDRFLREASAAGTIANPHIVETYDAGWLSSGEPYLVMELLQGEPLDARLENGQSVPIDEALLIVAQAARAVHAAHEAGIVHRDLKPENIFLAIDEDTLETFVKVLDFGVSKFDDGSGRTRATRDGAFMGTPQYMSPEQFLDGKQVDRRADIYSLGIILFECVTGFHPYPCDTLAQLARKIMVEEVPPPSSVGAHLPPALDRVLARALQKQPEERTATAEELARELDQIRTGDQVTIPHGSRWPSELPPARKMGERRAPKIPTAKVGTPPDLDPPDDSRVKATLKSERMQPTTTGGTVLVAGAGATPNGARVALLAVTAVALTAAVAIWAWPESTTVPTSVPAPSTNATPTSTTTTAPSATTLDSAAPAPAPAPAPSPSSSPTPPTTPPPTPPAVPIAPKPKDYADVDEFPDPR